MGIVYEAEQISLGRRVALKILPFAAMLDPRQLQRFHNEARAAASLRHPNIVGVHAVGCQRAVHFYAMEYVEGKSLAEVIQELREQQVAGSRQQAAGSRRRQRVTPSPPHPATPTLGSAETQPEPQAVVSTEGSHRTSEFFRSAARLAIQAAEALEHAHQMGVVHRDVKPSNLLVDDRGHLWVTDFGLAITPGTANLTMSGDLLGTLRYMSPEQVQAKHGLLDHRTDIYSLGVTLYELLALRPAFAGEDRPGLLVQIAEDEPPPPRRFNAAIPRDLETIVLKAMAKEPQQRYASAQELADDLKRFLADEPIRARRASLWERTAKWSRRHKALVASAASIAAILLVVALALSAQDREDARRRLLVQQGINEALAEVARLRGPTPAGPLGDQTSLGLAREQLQRALALAESGPADPELVARVQELSAELDEEHKNRQLLAAETYRRQAHDLWALGGNEQALAAAVEALRLKPTALNYTNRGCCYYFAGELDLAIADCDEAIRLDPRYRTTYDNRASARAENGDFEGALADWDEATRLDPTFWLVYVERAGLYVEKGQFDEAIAEYHKAIDRNFAFREAAGAYAGLAYARYAKGEYEAAIAEANAALGVGDRDYFAVRYYWAKAHYCRALAHAKLGRSDEARADLAQVAGANPSSYPHTCDLALCLAAFPDARLRNVPRALELAGASVAKFPNAGQSWIALGVARYRAGVYQGALAALEKSASLKSMRKAHGWFFLAMTYRQLGRASEARTWYDKAVAWMDSNAPKNEELLRFRAEAAELLGTPTKPLAGKEEAAKSK